MNQVLELAPLLAFFIAYVIGGLYWATGVLMIASVILVFAFRWRTGKFKELHVITAVLVVVLGSATLLLHDKRFIQWKPTVLYGLLAAALLISNVAGRRPWIQRLFESVMPEAIALSPRAWRFLTALWAAWFALTAAANMYVVRNFSESFWVHFHTYGISFATMVFMIPQIFWLSSKTSVGPPGPTDTDS
jgi:intracellular septation protein